LGSNKINFSLGKDFLLDKERSV